MQQPEISKMMGNLDSKYALVVATAKRARMLTDGDNPSVENLSLENAKPVTIAMQEIAAGKIDIQTTKGGIK
ncbi:MAG TPA: DNA-directed RNA polymerase subunit omega [Peptococcaceae bacterium]|mgnify:CR=1 FL=1|jgi:DNA-directed RNA polymerase subunit omega|nr:DNA-directed RNA polymerase subunit omega [Peptococcaceae bacterium]HPZ70848.1 DNA-directed RNA polymerase subunit omega [Peptococcaceae bacterium]HQD53681.1 DNA-directed RNA polymerase subunit omega [Peptococcaceae bacterium]